MQGVLLAKKSFVFFCLRNNQTIIHILVKTNSQHFWISDIELQVGYCRTKRGTPGYPVYLTINFIVKA